MCVLKGLETTSGSQGVNLTHIFYYRALYEKPRLYRKKAPIWGKIEPFRPYLEYIGSILGPRNH